MKYSVKSRIEKIQSVFLLRLPEEISRELPSRSMVMISGTVEGIEFIAPLEPDGKGSHFMPIERELLEKFNWKEKEEVAFEFDVEKNWPESVAPEDLLKRLKEEGLLEHWKDLTTKARWEWIRWIRSTKNENTRSKRIDTALSKFSKGDRRPCCFNSTQCTISEIAKSGKLMDR